MARVAALLQPQNVVSYGDFVRVIPDGDFLVVQKRPSPAFPWREVDRFGPGDERPKSSAQALAFELQAKYELAKTFPWE